MEDHHVLCVDAVSLGSVTLEVTTQGSWVHFTCHRPPRRKRVWTLCFTIYRDSFVVTATSKEATLTEYADRVPGNGQVRLSRQTNGLHPSALPLVRPQCPLPSREWGFCLACLRITSSPLSCASNTGQPGKSRTLPPSTPRG